MKQMHKIYNGNLLNIVEEITNNISFDGYDLIIIDLSNIDVNNINNFLSIISYIIKYGGNIIIFGNDKEHDVKLNNILVNDMLLTKQHIIIYKSSKMSTNNIISEYSYVLWYSDNYRNSDPQPVYNEVIENDQVLTDFWLDIDSLDKLYERIIKMFSNENDNIFNPCRHNSNLMDICEKLNRNYIGINYE